VDLPDILVVDNSPDLRGRALDGWADDHGAQLCFIDPFANLQTPTRNACIERFNGRYREECLNRHWFTSLREAREIIEDGRTDYNALRSVRLRRGPSDFGYDPMISPTLCQISFTALKSKFSLRPMAFAVGNDRMRTSSGSSRKVLSATGKFRPRRGGMAFADRC
jgi:hypothetical protein